ncbi:MAG: response regulator [Chitinivibrionales bacterium]|nr:response regulator [Chitinivibrionales bacterium]
MPMARERKVILVIDDEPEMREYMRFALERSGYAVVEAPDGAEGIKAFHGREVDLVITDLVMPNKEGVETIGALTAQCPELKIVAVSGAAYSDTYLQLVRRLGASACLQKPFDQHQLIATVATVLDAGARREHPQAG